MQPSSRFRRCIASFALLLLACGGTSKEDSTATGGRASDGGSDSATGGTSHISGGSTVGGESNTGGLSSNGGKSNGGGSANTGGLSSTGGESITGGSPNTGGKSSTGGKSNTGGAGTTGGLSSTGGKSNTGGAGTTGGTAGGEPSGLVDCDLRKVLCRIATPACSAGQVPSVNGTCYGPCVKIESCACSSAAECPNNDEYTCWGDKHCGPYVD